MGRAFLPLLLVLAVTPAGPAQAASSGAPSVPSCALGAESPDLRGVYRSELARAERRFGGDRAARRVFAAGVAAYVYGFAPVSVRQTVTRYPENQLVSIGVLTDPDVQGVVLPNHDTTYTVGRLRLGQGPLVIDVPDTRGRYYVLQLLDAYSNTIGYVGRRTTGTRAGSFAIVPRRWSGALPPGVRRVESPTGLVWVLGRTLVRGGADLPAATGVMRGYTVTPLERRRGGERQAPVVLPEFPSSPPTPLPEGLVFFDALGAVLAEDPPPRGDACALRAFARAGIGPGRSPATEASASTRRALTAALRAGAKLIRAAEQRGAAYSRRRNNGWLVHGGYIGDYGRNWLGRAVIALTALGANTPPETVYPIALSDSRGRPLTGRHRYTLRFPRGELPPARAFWSVTMYDDGPYLVDNPIDRYAIGDRTSGLRRGKDGSLTIHLSRTPPRSAAERANWLPAPRGRFRLALRLYEPERSVLRGSWKPPALRRR